MFKKILIANRGEIALRVIYACREMGIKTVAVYSEADENSLHVRFADEDVCIGPARATDSYLNVPALYQDSVFSPVYTLTYSSQGAADLAAKRRQIDGYLEQIKYVRFPENSIKAIYGSFIRNIGDRGVEKARAVVEHGKFYRGEDRQVRVLVDDWLPAGLDEYKVHADMWLKDLAPAARLREYMDEDFGNWRDYEDLCIREMAREKDLPLAMIIERAMYGTVTLLYSRGDEQHNNAIIVRDCILASRDEFVPVWVERQEAMAKEAAWHGTFRKAA